jgi:hypothetical protein
MKKIIAILAVGVSAISGMSQGLVTINQTSFNITSNSTSIGGGSGVIGGVANSFYFALLTIADPTGSTVLPVISSKSDLTSSWINTGITGTNGTGLTASKLIAIGGIPGATGTGLAGGGATNFFVVVGWSAALGSTWSAVASQIQSGNYVNPTALLGYTSVGYGVASDLAPGFSVFGSAAGQIPTTAGSFVLTPVAPVPEPSTLVLAGLGGLSLLAFRRKK